MTGLIRNLLLIVNIISTAATILFGVFGIYEQLMGPEDAQKLLDKMRIPVKYKHMLIVGFTCLLIMCITRILLYNGWLASADLQ